MKLVAGARLFDTGHNRKHSQPLARERDHGDRVRVVGVGLAYDDELEALRMLVDRRGNSPGNACRLSTGDNDC